MAFPTPLPAAFTTHSEDKQLWQSRNGRWEKRPEVMLYSESRTNTAGFPISLDNVLVGHARNSITANVIFIPKGTIAIKFNLATRNPNAWLGMDKWEFGAGFLHSHGGMWRRPDWEAHGSDSAGWMLNWDGVEWAFLKDHMQTVEIQVIDLGDGKSSVRWNTLGTNSKGNVAVNQGEALLDYPVNNFHQLAFNFPAVAGLAGVHRATVHLEVV